MNEIKVIITGATGMVGEGVVHVCLQHPLVKEVLIINRKPSGINHPKLQEIIHQDFYDFSGLKNRLSGYDACFHCMGISSVGIDAASYYKITYTMTMALAKVLCELNPAMTFCYVSGQGTDSSENGKLAWARIKGKTENDLFKLPFRQAFGMRPGFIRPIKGLKHTHKFYRYINWTFPLGRALFPNGFCTMEELATAMIALTGLGFPKRVINGKDITSLSKTLAWEMTKI
ncbi:epimerase [Chitinophaga caeni]|uniref:Epimerase n=1 Tax=Chitinophaga caeni TaxID=2029983 RepID=A0A291R0E2_9BACT|nr:NAD-dependent epimerase/dehydratase family protein [Chitinophaga caeni]ATL49670.1 epimerase [Chitinophaga caeni]